jgi:hypothetical protein
MFLEDIIDGNKFEGSVDSRGILEVPVDVNYKETLALKFVCR